MENLKCVCLLVGPHRSGSSVIRAIIDAHPNVMLGHESGRQEIYQKIANKQITKENVFNHYIKSAKNKTCPTSNKIIFDEKTKKVSFSSYVHSIPNQYQGKSNDIHIIGDKSGPWIAGEILKNKNFAKEMEDFFGLK